MYVEEDLPNGGHIEVWVSPPPAPSWSDSDLDPRYWWINVGPFFDRFNGKAINITSSTDPVVQGLLTLTLPREYIDLKRADLAGMLDILIAKGLITSADKTGILAPPTTEYERHIKGLPQPL
jgi:hypothetical protein